MSKKRKKKINWTNRFLIFGFLVAALGVIFFRLSLNPDTKSFLGHLTINQANQPMPPGSCKMLEGKTTLLPGSNMGIWYFGADLTGDVIPDDYKTCIESQSDISNNYLLFDIDEWTWSNNVGWISWHCDDQYNDPATTCSNTNDPLKTPGGYGVQAVFKSDDLLSGPNAIGYLSNYAWSQKTGWIAFDWLGQKLTQAGINWSTSAQTGGEYCTSNPATQTCVDFASPCVDSGSCAPKLTQDNNNSWKLTGYAWSQRAGWVLLDGPTLTGWNPWGLWAKVEMSKVLDKTVLGNLDGDGLMLSNGNPNMINGQNYSQFAVAGLPTHGEKDPVNCGDLNAYTKESLSNYSELEKTCLWPASGYAFKIGLGSIIQDTNILSQFVSAGVIKVIMTTDGGDIYSLQATPEGVLTTDITDPLNVSALRWGPSGNPTEFVKINCTATPVANCFLSDPGAPITTDKLAWVRTLTSAAPSHTGGLEFMNAPENDFSVTDLQVDFILGSQTWRILDMDGENLNICPASAITEIEKQQFCGVYKGQFRFKPPVQFNMKQNYANSQRDFITAYVDKPVSLGLFYDYTKLPSYYIAKAVLDNVAGGTNLKVLLKTDNDTVNFVFDNKARNNIFEDTDTSSLPPLPTTIFNYGNFQNVFKETPQKFVWDAIVKPDEASRVTNDTSEAVKNPRMQSVAEYYSPVNNTPTESRRLIRFSPGILPKPGIVGMGSEPVVDVKGVISVKSGVTGRAETEQKVSSIGDVSTALVRDTIVRNVAELTSSFDQSECEVTTGGAPGRLTFTFNKGTKRFEKPKTWSGQQKGCANDDFSVIYLKCTNAADCKSFGGYDPKIDSQAYKNNPSGAYVIFQGLDDVNSSGNPVLRDYSLRETPDMGDDTTRRQTLVTSDIQKNQTIIIEGMNVFIHGNIIDSGKMYLSNGADVGDGEADKKTLGLIVLGKKFNGDSWPYGGNLYVNTGSNNNPNAQGVDSLYVNMFLDGSLMRYAHGDYNWKTPDNKWLCGANIGAQNGRPGNLLQYEEIAVNNCPNPINSNLPGNRGCDSLTGADKMQCYEEPSVLDGDAAEEFLIHQLYIKGSLSSGGLKGGNTIGGADTYPDPTLGGGKKLDKRTPMNVYRAALYDLNRLSYFRLYYPRCGYVDNDNSTTLNSGDSLLNKTIDLQTGSCVTGSTGIEQLPFNPDPDGDGTYNLIGDLVSPNISEFSALYNYCKTKAGGCLAPYNNSNPDKTNSIFKVYFDIYQYAGSEVRRSKVWQLRGYYYKNGKILDHNNPVYFEYVEPANLPGFAGGKGGSTIQY